MLLLAIGIVFGACYLVSHKKDPRLLRNGPFLVAAIAFGGVGILLVLAEYNFFAAVALWLLALAIPLSILVFGIGLIANGITMLRREGHSLGNQLSLIVGVIVLALPVVSVVLVVQFGATGFWLAALIGLASAYASMAFVSFAVYSVVYGRMRHSFMPSAIVVHGSGLIRGRVPPLLRGRLDRGLQVYRKELARGNRPLLVPRADKATMSLAPRARRWPSTCATRAFPRQTSLARRRRQARARTSHARSSFSKAQGGRARSCS
ncbi:hypothetical protein GCM10027267_31570 [Paramicrobacterium agarici]